MMFFHDLYEFFHFVCVYFTVVLGFCTIMSVIVAGIIIVLRSTLFLKSVFGKAALWSLMIPCLFCGKLHFYYESRIGVRLFYWWHMIIARWQFICVIYWIGAVFFAVKFVRKRIRLRRMVAALEDGHGYSCKRKVKLFPQEISSFCTGVLKPIIVIPKDLPMEQAQTITRHEETHIMLGHLWIQFLWEVLRVLMWANPLLHICEKNLKRDLEEVCDAVTIKRNGLDAFLYAEILVENAGRLMAVEGRCVADSGMSFAADDNYRTLKRRLEKIVRNAGYNRSAIIAGALILAIGIIFSISFIKTISYKRTNDIGMRGTVCNTDREYSIKAVDVDYENDIVKDFDDDFISIDGDALMERYPQAMTEDEYFYFTVGGYYKLPGIGGGGGWGELEAKDIRGGIIKIENHSQIDFWNRIIMWL